ncbi:tol-pal system protein YbgF [Halomonas cerina]|uniref:Cell division coordinator CpoB n=1 Tax=Halomonas cerina TaxID=447424 RepID=A0A839V8V9_9GAMM|nr:tol-pal system protein YbgF [Halomonas cerina]MBB3189144.1 tol-pal system protein YbgF [Halomonas cerina]
MRHGLKGLCGVGLMALPLAVAIAQQPVVEDLTDRPGSFYDQAATRTESGGSLVLFNQVQQHQEEIQQLRGQVEELRYQLEQLRRQTRQQYLDLDERLSRADAQSASSPPPAETPDTSTPEPTRGEASAGAGDGAARQAYQAAFAKVQAREFAAATTDFEAFVAQHPDSALTANAYYWLGELHSAESELEAAERAFQRVLEDFPDSGKVPDTLYKLGLLKIRQGAPDAGRALLERVINDYPESSAANLAGDYLRQSGT